MKIGRGGKITVGVLTLLAAAGPFLFVGVMFLMMFGMMLTGLAAETSSQAPAFFFLPFGIFMLVFPLQFVFVFLLLGLQVFYFIHVLRNTAAPEVARILLGLGFFFLPYLAMPIYFLMYVWKDEPTAARVPPAPPAPALPAA